MIGAPKAPDGAKVQRLIPFGYVLNCSRHFVLQVRDPVRSRRFIGELVAGDLITNATVKKEDVTEMKDRGKCPANIGFTFRGLEKLQLRVPYQRVFQEKAKAFVQGASARAAQYLADSGPSAAQCWDKRFAPDHAHVLLSVYADTHAELKQFAATLRGIPGAGGLSGWTQPFEGCQLTDTSEFRTEHFGFRDGISNPVIEGFPPNKPNAHAPGEFLLGYPNDDKFNPWLLINPSTKPNPWLRPLNPAPQLTEFFRDGSFAAFRQLAQDVQRFQDSVERWATQLGGGQDPEKWQDYVKAKLGGRWWNGAIVQPGRNDPPPRCDGYLETKKLNDFDFSEDTRAHGCPFGAHIRRMNPRKDPVVPFPQRPLIRRGMPYGPTVKQEPDAPRGLLGLFFCASLEDQFELLLSQWGNANPLGPDDRGNARDPLASNRQHPGACFDIPIPGEALRQLDGFSGFVTTRGTLYAFFPSVDTVGRIARCGPPAHPRAPAR
jgi:deferrochelatase/peroxidase EfeB